MATAAQYTWFIGMAVAFAVHTVLSGRGAR
jgi:cytosine/uracil/thiamine/allantoin permease